MTTLLFAVSSLLFGTWFALSVVNQFRSIRPRAFWLENFTFIPRWWFFKYNFEEGEFRISVRYVEGDDDESEWEVLDLPRAPFWRQWVWNPEMRLNKELWDACTRLCALPQWLRFSKNFSPSTVAYRALWVWVASTPPVAEGPGGAMRMMIERVPLTPGAGDAVVWFVSRPFAVRAPTEPPSRIPVG